jgi:demethoxyubiquinone hydroxylase (CLK1/Coq7/Cat5 family)
MSLSRPFAHVIRRAARAHSTLASAAYTDASLPRGAATTGTPSDLSAADRAALHASLRVDQAGEVAADYIYRGQLAVLKGDAVIQVRVPMYLCMRAGLTRA